MSKETISLNVRSRGKPIKSLPQTTTISPSNSTAELYSNLAAAARYSPYQLSIKKGDQAVPNAKDVTISQAGLHSSDELLVKDLGPQISWRTVFYIEYLGPILIHPLFLLFRGTIYNTRQPTSSIQYLTAALILVHFVKRELETALVHRFSNATMPAMNIFKNSAHYWLLGGVNVAYWTYAPWAWSAKPDPMPLVTIIGLVLFAMGEAGNLYTHLVLRDLRKPGSTERGIPHGIGFENVTCPNYMFEVMAWVGIVYVGRSWSVALFAIVAGAQMAVWAMKKEKRYRKEFPDTYKKKEFVMLPGVV